MILIHKLAVFIIIEFNSIESQGILQALEITVRVLEKSERHHFQKRREMPPPAPTVNSDLCNTYVKEGSHLLSLLNQSLDQI